MLLSVFNFYYLGILRLAILLFRTFHRMARLWNYGARIVDDTPWLVNDMPSGYSRPEGEVPSHH